MIELKNIAKTLGDFKLSNISFSVDSGDYFVVLGKSGAGKTVLLEMIAGLTAPDSGKVILAGRDITTESIQNRNIGLVYQDQSIFPHLSVAQNIAYPLKCRKMGKSGAVKEVRRLAETTGVTYLLNRRPMTLSVGEAQRVALARALATSPELLLLDEPLASLDVQAKLQMRALLRKLNGAGQTIIQVTHDYEEAVALAGKLAVMEAGTVVQTGSPEDIFQHPKSAFIAGFVGIKNFYRGSIKRKSEDLVVFKTAELEIDVVTDAADGSGCLILRGEDISVANEEPRTSARNHFKGCVLDLEPARLGVEVRIDIGIQITAIITSESVEALTIREGGEIWVNFKATAARYLPDGDML